MDYYSEVCLKHIKTKSKYKHFISNIHKKLDSCKQVDLTIETPHINDIDELFYA